MPDADRLQPRTRSSELELFSPRAVLAALLLVLLSGLPQICISLSSLDFAEERMTSVPITRSVLLDKLLPEVASLTPPHLSDFPPVLVAPPSLSYLLFDGYFGSWEEPSPSPWRRDLARRLHRHNSSYV